MATRTDTRSESALETHLRIAAAALDAPRDNLRDARTAARRDPSAANQIALSAANDAWDAALAFFMGPAK